MPNCSECKKPMIVRVNHNTDKEFYGCVDFPRCKDRTGLNMDVDAVWQREDDEDLSNSAQPDYDNDDYPSPYDWGYDGCD